MLCCCKEPESSPPPSKKHQSKTSKHPVTNSAAGKQTPNHKNPNRARSKSPAPVNPDSIYLREKKALSRDMAGQMEALVARLEAVTSRLEGVASVSGGGGGGASTGEDSPFVQAYDEIMSGPLRQFLSVSTEIGGDVQKAGEMVKNAFKTQRDFLVVASKSKKPSQEALMKALQPTSKCISDIQEFRVQNRQSDMCNHLAALSESIPALGWVAVNEKPYPYATELMEAGKFYTNRVLKDFKAKDAKHVTWVKMWIETLTQLIAYIKQHHTTGVSWNPKGGDIGAATSGGSPAGGPPPPPPPPPVEAPTGDASSSHSSSGHNALFADLNKGADITKGLKKVSDDQKTHKNPALRSGPQPFKPSPHSSPKPFTAPKPGAHAHAAQKPPVFKLEGKKWLIEHQVNNQNLVVDKVNMKQTVYIYKCQGCTVQVKGKVNTVIIDTCKKTGVVFEDVVGSVEFINCQSVKGQATGTLPTLSIDKTDGCQVYLNEKSLACAIVTAKSSEMNIAITKADGDLKEFPLPEQFRTTWDGKKFTTEVMELKL